MLSWLLDDEKNLNVYKVRYISECDIDNDKAMFKLSDIDEAYVKATDIQDAASKFAKTHTVCPHVCIWEVKKIEVK